MNALAIAVCVCCQLFMVIGQVMLKHAMNAAEKTPKPWRRVSRDFLLGVGCLTVWFFLWLGLLGRWQLSRLFPFEGLNPALIALAAWFFLKERLNLPAIVGMGLISVGIALVIGS